LAKRKARKRKVTRRKAVRRRAIKRKPIGRKIVSAFRHEAVREAISAILIIAILYFGAQGTMFLILRTDSPMMAVVSPSMEPTFERGDLLFVQGVHSPDEIKISDIIVYQETGDGKQIVHRIVDIEIKDNRVEITTKGDANQTNDPPIGFEQVRGKVVFWLPKLGYISLWLRGE
jgi:signal peptidase